MTLYLSGKITGLANYKQIFDQAHRQLEGVGYVVRNPALIDFPESATWEDMMRFDLSLMLLCDGVAFLSNWTESKGARMELEIADRLKMECCPVSEWVSRRL